MPSEPAQPCNFGGVVLVRFPFTSQTAFKQRPAVVVSSSEYNRARPDVVIMAITSQLRAQAAFGEVWNTKWQSAHLLKPSAVKPVFATIEQALIVKPLGILQPPDVDALHTAISTVPC